MDDILLINAVERYRKGEMSPQEITFFEELRKNNPDIDQLAAEHTFFLAELEKMSDIKAFKHNLDEVETQLTNEGIISRRIADEQDDPISIRGVHAAKACEGSFRCFAPSSEA